MSPQKLYLQLSKVTDSNISIELCKELYLLLHFFLGLPVNLEVLHFDSNQEELTLFALFQKGLQFDSLVHSYCLSQLCHRWELQVEDCSDLLSHFLEKAQS